MAHIEKFQAPALGNMLRHYRRQPELENGYRRANIDHTRTHLNYNLQPRDVSELDFINRRIEELDLKRAPRKNAVRMIDTVVTLPQDYEGDTREFMQAAKDTLDEIFGQENCVSAYVHMDEAQPHMHYASVPVTQDGRLSAKDLLNRNFMKQFHPRLEKGVCERLGIERAGLTLDEETRAKRVVDYVGLSEFKDAMAEKERLDARLEYLRQREAEETRAVTELDRAIKQAELQPTPEKLSESLRTLLSARKREEGLRTELEEARERNRGCRERLNRVTKSREGVRETIQSFNRAILGIREQNRSKRAEDQRLRERLETLEQRVAATVAATVVQLAKIPHTLFEKLSNTTRGIIVRLGVPVGQQQAQQQQQLKTIDQHALMIERAKEVARVASQKQEQQQQQWQNQRRGGRHR